MPLLEHDRSLPTAIADNGGLDSSELVSQLRALHAQSLNTMGLDMQAGRVGDMQALGITESLKTKTTSLGIRRGSCRDDPEGR